MSTKKIELLPLSEIGTPECERWRKKIFCRYGDLRKFIERYYRWVGTTQDHVAANLWLRETAKRMKLGGTGLAIDCTYETMSDYAEVKSKACEQLIHDAFKRVGAEGMLTIVAHEVNRTGIKFPLDTTKEQSKEAKVAAIARLQDPSWWRRKLSSWQARELEALNRELGLVSYSTGPYISNLSLRRRKERKRENRKLLEKLEAENELGQKYTLAQLADLSTSNPAIRRTELMVHMRGFEDIANGAELPYVGKFYTLTCPSKYHANLKAGRLNTT
ncbi:replication endonuclease [Saccharophagus degradans]|nr:replication endonuclease [Saccharophagus degradans]